MDFSLNRRKPSPFQTSQMDGGGEEILQEKVSLLQDANFVAHSLAKFASLLIQQKLQLTNSLLNSTISLHRDAIAQLHFSKSPLRVSKHTFASLSIMTEWMFSYCAI